MIARVDLDAVAARIDVEAVVDRLDLTETVLTRVDLKRRGRRVLEQVDLPALVEGVLDEIDLPEIIRDSTGTMASETVRSVRMQGVNADETVTRVVDRLLMRRAAPRRAGSADRGRTTTSTSCPGAPRGAGLPGPDGPVS